MSQQMIVWCTIVGLLSAIFAIQAIGYINKTKKKRGNKHHHLIEYGKDKDIFYVPGDVDMNDEYDEF